MQRMVRSANACEMVSYTCRQQGALGNKNVLTWILRSVS
jgi:hypothetical protein